MTSPPVVKAAGLRENTCACVIIHEWVGIRGAYHLKLLFFGCQCLVDKLLNPQCLQLYFLTHVHQLVLVKREKKKTTQKEAEHHVSIISWRDNRKILLFKYHRGGISKEYLVQSVTHP